MRVVGRHYKVKWGPGNAVRGSRKFWTLTGCEKFARLMTCNYSRETNMGAMSWEYQRWGFK